MGDIPEVPGSGEEESLHCWAPKDLFLPLLAKVGDIGDFSNTKKQTEG